MADPSLLFALFEIFQYIENFFCAFACRRLRH
jgi:hypothetical protein